MDNKNKWKVRHVVADMFAVGIVLMSLSFALGFVFIDC